MRIAIDYTAAVHQGGGIGRYTKGLVKALMSLDRQNEYTLFVAGQIGTQDTQCTTHDTGYKPDLDIPSNFRLKSIPVSDRVLNIVWHRLRLPLPVEAFTGKADVFHSPDFVLPLVWRARAIVTVHDLSFMRTPQCAEPSLRAYLNKVVPRSIQRADLILADSHNTKRDIIELLGVDARKIQVVPAGVGERFHPIDDEATLEKVRRRYHLEEPFILSVSTLEPRKNFTGLIEAYAQLIERGSQIQRIPHKLVIAGAKGWLYEEIFATVERLGLAERVIFPGFVAEEDLPALYNLADLLAFPSLYEGFGLPPLEAMACGTPVVTSNSSSLPEIVGGVGIMVEATDTEGLVEAMRRALQDGELRRSMIEKGLEQAKKFSWRKAAEKLLGAYRRMEAHT